MGRRKRAPVGPSRSAPGLSPVAWLLGACARATVGAVVAARTMFPSEDARSGSGAWFILLAFVALTLAGMAAAFSGRRPTLHGFDALWLVLLAVLWTSALNADYRYAAVWSSWEWTAIAALALAVRLLGHPNSAPPDSPSASASAIETRTGDGILPFAIILLLGLSLGLSVYACVQEFSTLPDLRRRFERRDPVLMAEVRRLGLANEAEGAQRFRDRLESKETPATFGLANTFAGFLTLTLPLFFAGAAAARSNRDRALSWGGLLLVAFALLLTRSRTAWVAALAVVPLFVWFERRTGKDFAVRLHRWALLTLVLLGLVGGLAYAGIFDRLVLTESTKSLRYRLEYWSGALGVIRERPLLGVGFGNFQSHYLRHKLPQASEEVEDPHNFLFELWACSGPLAAAAYVLLLSCSLLKLATAAAMRPKASERAVGWAPTIAVLLGIGLVQALASIDGEAALLVALTAPAATMVFGGRLELGGRWWTAVAIAMVALHIHLLGAGGIGFPALMLPAWTLASAALAGGGFETSSQTESSRRSRPWVGWTAAAAGCAIAISYHQTLLGPWSRREQIVRSLRNSDQGSPAAMAAVLQGAAEAMPGDQTGWASLAVARQQEMMEAKEPAKAKAAYLEAVKAWETACQLEPRKAANYRSLAQLYLAADKAAGIRGARDAAAASLSWVVLHYPNSARNQLEYADVLFDMGKQSEAVERYAKALELDQITPHIDKKLAADARHRAASIVRAAGRKDP